MKSILLIFSILVTLVSCDNNQKPEQVLRSYINLRFQKSTDLSTLKSLTTGDLLRDLGSLGKEEKVKFEQTHQLKDKRVKILGRDCGKEQCKITYIVSYKKESKDNPYVAEIRNIATLKLVDGSWKIATIGGLKSYFESKKDIEP